MLYVSMAIACLTSGQDTIERCQASADFFYEDWKAAIFIDGPHHDDRAQASRRVPSTASSTAAGYSLCASPRTRGSWPDIFKTHADLFGTGNT
jgi:hypothetical protein